MRSANRSKPPPRSEPPNDRPRRSADAKAEANSLKEALEKYGEHDVGCALLGTHEPCSCGLDNILDAITKE